MTARALTASRVAANRSVAAARPNLARTTQHGPGCACAVCGPAKRGFFANIVSAAPASANHPSLFHRCSGPHCPVCTVAGTGFRSFSTAPAEELKKHVTDRVLSAVKKHLSERLEDLSKEMEEPNADKPTLSKQMELLKSEVSENSTWNDFAFDQFDRVEVLLEVEEMFGHMIPDDDADAIGSVSECIDYMLTVDGVEGMMAEADKA